MVSEGDDPLGVADGHLYEAARALAELGSLGRVRATLAGPAFVAAAAEQVAAAVAVLRGQVALQRAAAERLELVTSGDERLIDDLAAALELLQADVEQLRVRQDLLEEDRPTR